MTENVTTLEQEAINRKERLKALKRKGTSQDSSEETGSLPRPQFRNYQPITEDLKQAIAEPAKPGDVESQVIETLEKAKELPVTEELDIMNLAPRKPDWDLKRDVAKKLELLERRTQRAIAELIRERLKENALTDIAETVSVGATTHQREVDDD